MYKYLEEFEELLDNIISNESGETVDKFLEAVIERAKELQQEEF